MRNKDCRCCLIPRWRKWDNVVSQCQLRSKQIKSQEKNKMGIWIWFINLSWKRWGKNERTKLFGIEAHMCGLNRKSKRYFKYSFTGISETDHYCTFWTHSIFEPSYMAICVSWETSKWTWSLWNWTRVSPIGAFPAGSWIAEDFFFSHVSAFQKNSYSKERSIKLYSQVWWKLNSIPRK